MNKTDVIIEMQQYKWKKKLQRYIQFYGYEHLQV